MKIKLTLLFIFFFFSTNAQTSFVKDQINKKFFIQKGMELDYTIFPFNSVQIENEIYENQWESAGLNLSYVFRFNILEFEEDQAISISTAPTLGISFGFNHNQPQLSIIGPQSGRDVFGIGNINLPFEFNYHIGKGATKNSTYKYGVTFTFGREYRFNPIIIWSELPEYQLGLKKNYNGYILKVGFTREKKRIHEIYARTVLFRNQPRVFDPLSSFIPAYRSSGNFSIGLRLSHK